MSAQEQVVATGTSTIVVSARALFSGGFVVTQTSLFGVWRSTNNGATWAQVSSIGGIPIYALERDPADDTFLVAVAAAGVWVSTDSGTVYLARIIVFIVCWQLHVVLVAGHTLVFFLVFLTCFFVS